MRGLNFELQLMTTMHTGIVCLHKSPTLYLYIQDIYRMMNDLLNINIFLNRVVLEVLKRHRDRPELLGKALQTLASIASTSTCISRALSLHLVKLLIT